MNRKSVLFLSVASSFTSVMIFLICCSFVVTVSTSNYDAEFGRAGGAVTNVTLKSGTNQLKGVAFFYGNGNGTLAKDYFSGLKADTSYKQYGLALGGPAVRRGAVRSKRGG